LHWKAPGAKVPGKIGLAAFRFAEGTLTLTEAGSKKRASLFLVRGQAALAQHDPGGLDVLAADLCGLSARRSCRILGPTDARKPHPQAGLDRSAAARRHRQRLLRRDSARRPSVAP